VVVKILGEAKEEKMEDVDTGLHNVKQLLRESSNIAERIASLSNERRSLNPLPGSLRKRRMRCGKQSCRCKAGFLHGPYYYFEPSRQHGKWRYVSKMRLAEVKRGISDWKKQQDIDKAMQALSERLETVLKEIQREIALLMHDR
jgi:hypothetical protein